MLIVNYRRKYYYYYYYYYYYLHCSYSVAPVTFLLLLCSHFRLYRLFHFILSDSLCSEIFIF